MIQNQNQLQELVFTFVTIGKVSITNATECTSMGNPTNLN